MQHTDQLLTTDTAILNDVPLERLESEIASFASRLAAATARWLIWIAAYDRRQGWASWETKSCAHWLNWHCGVSPRTAREHVQIGHKLEAFTELRNVPQTNVKPVSGTAVPLGGTGERANLDYIADVLISNTELRKQRLGLTSH